MHYFFLITALLCVLRADGLALSLRRVPAALLHAPLARVRTTVRAAALNLSTAAESSEERSFDEFKRDFPDDQSFCASVQLLNNIYKNAHAGLLAAALIERDGYFEIRPNLLAELCMTYLEDYTIFFEDTVAAYAAIERISHYKNTACIIMMQSIIYKAVPFHYSRKILQVLNAHVWREVIERINAAENQEDALSAATLWLETALVTEDFSERS